MNEAETRAELIDPALKIAGWGVRDTNYQSLEQTWFGSGFSTSFHRKNGRQTV